MINLDIEVEGIAPILFNRFTEEAQEQVDKGSSAKKKNKQQRIDDAVLSCYFDKDGFLGVPAVAIKKCWLEGCGFAGLKIGRRSAVPFFRATIFLEQSFVKFVPDRKESDGIHEATGRRPPRTGGRVIIRRPYLNTGWKLRFKATLTDGRVDPDMAKQAFIEAGLLCGLCDHRPDYGRFKVNRFKAIK